MKTKRLYQAPLTERVLVELEGGFCASVVKNDPHTGHVETEGHEINNIDGSGFNVSQGSTGWENNGWE